MPLHLYLGFVLATFVLVLIPGPNVSLLVANSLAHGSRRAFLTLAGTGSATTIQLTLVVFGMTTAMAVLATWFDRLRWIGVAYLLWLGLRSWMARPDPDAMRAPAPTPARRLFGQGFAVAMTNPKTLAFFAAFLPQFVDPARPVMPQFVILSATFLVIAIPCDAAWCLLAGRLRPWLLGGWIAALRTKIIGGFLIACGVGLALARRA